MRDELLAGLLPLVCGFVALLVFGAVIAGGMDLLADAERLVRGVLP